MNKKNIALIGFMATGKTVVSKILSQMSGKPRLSTDELIETKEGRAIPEIFNEPGEKYFRKLEKEAVKEASSRNGVIIDCGGGVALDPENITILKENCFLVCLVSSIDHIYERVKEKVSARPLLNTGDPKARIRELLEERGAAYRQADMTISTDNVPLDTVCRKILEVMENE